MSPEQPPEQSPGHSASLVEQVADRLRAVGCVFAEDEARLLVEEATTTDRLEEMVIQRLSGLPLEQVLGWAEFCGLRVVVAPGVFVPRRRTELLVRQAADLARTADLARPADLAETAEHPPAARVRPTVAVDLCCGTGAVAAALAALVEGVVVHAADVDPAAVACARRNLPAGGQVHEGDLYAALPDSLRGRVDLLLANAPYVPTAEIPLMPPEAREHEARVALDGGADGLDVQRRIIADSPRWLAPGGHLLVETSEAQAPRTAEAFARSRLVPRTVRCEEIGATVVVGSLADTTHS